ncbi:unnamed protein product [Closterium sp. NIES-65]|nr:unnamed protein product [Closterium sp. NIES-65]
MIQDCGENGYCEEVQGRTTCRCNTGFAKTADGCCVKDEDGAASCVCDAGFTLRDDGKSCAAVVLPPAASNRRYPRGQEKDAEGNCVDVCTVRNYGPNSRCLKNEAGWANCECERGLNLLPNASCARTHAYTAVRQGTPAILPFLSVRQGTPAILPFLSLSCTLTRSLLLPGLMCVFSCCVCQPDRLVCDKGLWGERGLDCGENAYCEKEQDRAVCHCNWGYAMTDTGCVDTCILQACGENGRCVKDAAGMASCVCDIGFTLQDDGRTCIGKDAVPCCVRVLLRPSVFCCCVSHVLTCSLPFFPNLSTSSSLSLYRFLSLFLYLFLYLFL